MLQTRAAMRFSFRDRNLTPRTYRERRSGASYRPAAICNMDLYPFVNPACRVAKHRYSVHRNRADPSGTFSIMKR